MPSVRSSLPHNVAGVYIFWALVWIVFSDQALERWGGEGTSWVYLESLKGAGFVLVTGGLLYQLLRRVMARVEEAEMVVRTQEERWRLALEAVGDGVWEMNAATGWAHYSRSWKSMLGYAEEDIGESVDDWLSRIHVEDRVRVEQELACCLDRRTPNYRCEYRLRAKDGRYRWILARGGLLTASRGAGGGTRVIGTHTDITARKSAEARMADTLAFTKAVLQSSPTGIIAFKATGEAVIANESAARIVGTTVSGLLRQNFRELASWQSSGLLHAATEVLANGRTGRHCGPFTSIFGASLWINAYLVPFTYQEEKHLLLLLDDETGERSALDKLRLMQVAAQAAPVGWVVTDAQGCIEWVNPAFTALTGYAAEEVVGKSPRVLKSGRQPPEYYKAMWTAIQRGEVWSGEIINRRKDGSFYHEFNTIAPVRDKEEVITHYVAIKQDISERKQLELQLSRAQRLDSIGQLACGMVHDLNNMLAPIMLSLGLIRAQHSDPETQGYIQMMENAAQRGAGVLRQVLTFAQGVEGERTPLEAAPLLKEVAQLAQETFPRQIQVQWSVGPGVSQISGDLTQVHQVLLNLAVNARDAMPQGGALTLQARNVAVDEARAARQVIPVNPGHYVCFTVRDTGGGIPPEVMEHMFEPFFTTKPRGKGTGLGLSTVFGIVRSYQGFIEVTTALGEGTEIAVFFPVVARSGPETREAETPAIRLEGAGRKILVVEDEPVIRQVTCQVLARQGFTPVAAEDGRDGLGKFIADPAGFVAVITDLMMPHMNGYELVRELRQRVPELPILVSSGLSTDPGGESGVETLRQLGVWVLLPKPYTEAQLLGALARELAGRASGGL